MRQSVKLSSENEFGFTKTCTVKHVHDLVKFPVDDGFAAVDVFDPHLDVVAECSACHLQTGISVLHGSAADPARAVKEAVVQPLYGPAVAGEPQGEHVACLAGAADTYPAQDGVDLFRDMVHQNMPVSVPGFRGPPRCPRGSRRVQMSRPSWS